MSAPLSISNSTIKVMNAALVQIGVNSISSFLENSLAARTGNALFADILEAELAGYPWRFARDRVKLSLSDAPPPPPWSAVYQFPTGALAVHAVYEGDQKTIFDRFGQKIVTMTPADPPREIWAEVTMTVGPDQWAGYFRRAFTLALASALVMPLTEDQSLAEKTAQVAAAAMAYARSRDAQGRTPSRIDTKAFVRARRGGRA